MQTQQKLSFILQCLKPFCGWIIGCFLIGIIWAIDVSLRPYLLKLILDKIPTLTPENASTELAVPTIFYITMTLLIVIIFRILDATWLKINLPLQQIIGNRLMNRMMQQSQLFLQDQFRVV